MTTADATPEPPELPAPTKVEPARLAPVEEPKGSGGFRRFMRRLVNFLIIVVILGGIGIGIYFGWPVAYERYFQPVAENTADLETMDVRLAEVEGQVASLQADAAAAGVAFDDLAAQQAAFGAESGEVAAQIAAHDRRLDALDATVSGLDASVDDASLAFIRELDMLRSMELLSRARLFLYQANYGLAAQDLEAARSVLLALEPGSDAEQIDEAILRVGYALNALPDRPVPASDDLDIAWQVLLGTVPVAPPAVVEEPADSTPTTTTP